MKLSSDDLHLKITGNEVDGYTGDIYDGEKFIQRLTWFGSVRQPHIGVTVSRRRERTKFETYKAIVKRGRVVIAEIRKKRKLDQQRIETAIVNKEVR